MNSIIIFHDGSKKQVTTSRAEKIWELSAKQDGFMIAGSYYKFSTVAKILTLEEYYCEYPDERPDPTPIIEESRLIAEPKYVHSRARALASLIKGLEQYIASDKYQGTENPKKILEKAKRKLEEAKAGEPQPANVLQGILY
jgi:hypothetical protein